MTATHLLVYFLSFFGVVVETEVAPPVPPQSHASTARDDGDELIAQEHLDQIRRISNGF